MPYDIITILGPTACGKTKLAAELCYQINGEIISADSRQVYKKMDIGTGKDLTDYVVQGKSIPFHLIDLLEPGEKYHVFRFKTDFYNAYEKIKQTNAVPVLCGGSGMYLEAVLRNYNLLEVPENKELREELEKYSLEELTQRLSQYKRMHNKTDVDTKKRAVRAIEIEEYYRKHPIFKSQNKEIKSLTFGIEIDRDLRREKISKRLKDRIDQGMIDEVKQLLNQGIASDDLIYYGLEYKYVTEYILGKYSFDEFFKRLETAIHQFAKRQMTYFRGMERRGVKINWLSAKNGIQENVKIIIEQWNRH
ncbi:MAG TPA: tRNA (adenosine(37)-N6)-dimethylallyltransferase MiaA [Bacteroidales bacterium]|jgi:tRNA dimethylallyltransferase|nr:tRNA (adenosine(37)-N6)-dimethylallyltransferase MiaA [Bacteroidales bacterium]HNV95554.1 tRNA (adenosine(37)-N6)-dimethylallyltransferase MiaA [Bacteroidales bacterium]